MLDLIRFQQFYNVYSSIPFGTDNVHERDNARRMAERMASREGMTLAEAEASIKIHVTASSSTHRRAYDDMKAQAWRDYVAEQERKRKEAADRKREEEERKRAEEDRKRREAVRYEQVCAIWRRSFPESPVEIALRQASDRLGIDPAMPLSMFEATPSADSAARTAALWPSTFAEAISELETLEQAEQNRRTKVPDYVLGGLVSLRRALLLNYLCEDATSAEDAAARACWLRRQNGPTPGTDVFEWMRMLCSDIVRMEKSLGIAKAKLRRARGRQASASEMEQGRRSNFDKRQAVLNILATPDGKSMTLREIAERAGVHHATVANIKRQMERASNFDTRQRN